MLCPRCGVDVGKMSQLCPVCRRDQRMKAEGGEKRASFNDGKEVDHPGGDYDCCKRRLSRLRVIFYLALVVLLGAVWAVIWSSARLSQLLPSRERRGANDFSHINIAERPTTLPGVTGKFGVFEVDGAVYGLVRAESTMDENNRVSVFFYTEASVSDESETEESIVQVRLTFKPGESGFSVSNLQGYELDFKENDETLQVYRSFTRRLTSFAEAAQFNGTLRKGAAIRGFMSDKAVLTSHDRPLRVSWNLQFETELK